MNRPARGRATIAAGLLLVAGAACTSDEEPVTYTEDNRRAFLTSCTRALEDQRLVRDICECAYEEIRVRVPYTEFVELEQSLQLDALTPLPDHVARIVADCFLAEAEL